MFVVHSACIFAGLRVLTFGSGGPMPRSTGLEIYDSSRVAALGRLEPYVRTHLFDNLTLSQK